MAPLVSWLIPVKNGMPYLPQTLASIEAQTFRDFEVLVWDNGSDDGTVEELQRWIPSRLPGRIVHDQPAGLSAARAALVLLSQAEFCALLDADDVAHPQRLTRQIEFLRAHPDVALVGSQLAYIDAGGQPRSSFSAYPLAHEDIVLRMLTENSIGQPSVVFRREKVLEAGNYATKPASDWGRDGKLNGVEDYDLWLRLATVGRLVNLDLPLTHYRIHPKSITQKSIQENLLNTKVREVFARGSEKLFAWDENTARRFQACQIGFMFGPAWKLARFRAARAGTTPWHILRRPAMIEALWSRMSKKDLFSRFLLALLDPRISLLARLKRKLLVRKEARRRRQKLSAWYQQRRLEGCYIDPVLTFKGRTEPEEWIRMGPNVMIEQRVTIWISDDAGADPWLGIGVESYVGPDVFLGAYQPLSIGARVLIGAGSYIISGNHNFARRDLPIREQGYTGGPISIEDDVWLGAHVVVLPGVTIGKGAIIGAGSVVTKNVPAWEVWGGVPARFLKHRP